MAEELKDQRIPIMMSPSEVKAIDDWAFAHRIKSRGEAIRRLTVNGMRFEPFVRLAGIGLAAMLEFENSGTISDKTRMTGGETARAFSEAVEKLNATESTEEFRSVIELSEKLYPAASGND